MIGMKVIFSLRLAMIGISCVALLCAIVTTMFGPRIRAHRLELVLKSTGVEHVGFGEDLRPIWISVRESSKLPLVDDYAELRSVSTIDLSHGNLNIDSLYRLESFVNLRLLDVSDATLSDAVVAGLCALDTVEVLRARNTAITDASLEDFVLLPRLRLLDIAGTNMTECALEKFARRRPDVTVITERGKVSATVNGG